MFRFHHICIYAYSHSTNSLWVKLVWRSNYAGNLTPTFLHINCSIWIVVSLGSVYSLRKHWPEIFKNLLDQTYPSWAAGLLLHLQVGWEMARGKKPTRCQDQIIVGVWVVHKQKGLSVKVPLCYICKKGLFFCLTIKNQNNNKSEFSTGFWSKFWSTKTRNSFLFTITHLQNKHPQQKSLCLCKLLMYIWCSSISLEANDFVAMALVIRVVEGLEY